MRGRSSLPHDAQLRPLQVEQVDLEAPLPALESRDHAGGAPYEHARVLVRLHSYPLGTVDVALPDPGAPGLRRAIDSALRAAIDRHLRADGVADEAADVAEPACQADRRSVLADPPPVTVIVPTRDRRDSLERCVASVLACAYPPERIELIVVDNAPSDDSTRAFAESLRASDPRVVYARCDVPGSASARNAGAARAGSEILVMVDDDVVVDRWWIAELVRGFSAAPDVACVTGLVVPAALDTPAQLLFEQYGGFGKGYERRVYDLGAHRPDHPLFPFNAGIFGSGNNVALRRPALLAAGGYDPQLGNGTPACAAEDFELFLRLARQGRTIAYEPGAIVHHRHRREMSELQQQVHEYGVGVGAALTRTVVRDPRALAEVLRRLPYGLWFVLASGSPKNRKRTGGYPASLRRTELSGLVRGPAAYARSRRRAS